VVLAAAAAVARRERLPPPVAATVRAPHVPSTDETRWQERVAAHAGIEDWVRVEVHDELDVVGPYAARVLRANGLLWPCNVHFHLPLFDLARGGSLLTGIGGDELFAAASARSWRRRAVGWAPPALRRAAFARRERVSFPWLRPAARRVATAARADESAAEPRGLAGRLAWWRGLRYLHVALAGIGAVAASAGVELGHPLLTPLLWSATAARGGFADRTAGMRTLFGDVLPADVLARRSKASFDGVFFNRHSRDLVREWGGDGVPAELVDAHALRAHWAGGAPAAQSFTLLQAIWLARERVQQPLQAVVQ
jgi:hypothetical protein